MTTLEKNQKTTDEILHKLSTKIDMLIDILRELNNQESVDIKCFNSTMFELKALNFYLLEEDCIEINDIFPKIQEKMKTNIKIVHEKFQADYNMNESYYL